MPHLERKMLPWGSVVPSVPVVLTMTAVQYLGVPHKPREEMYRPAKGGGEVVAVTRGPCKGPKDTCEAKRTDPPELVGHDGPGTTQQWWVHTPVHKAGVAAPGCMNMLGKRRACALKTTPSQRVGPETVVPLEQKVLVQGSSARMCLLVVPTVRRGAAGAVA